MFEFLHCDTSESISINPWRVLCYKLHHYYLQKITRNDKNLKVCDKRSIADQSDSVFRVIKLPKLNEYEEKRDDCRE